MFQVIEWVSKRVDSTKLLSSTVRLCYSGSEKEKCSLNQKDVQLVERKQ